MQFNLKEYWENRYKNKNRNAKGNGSGAGSEGAENDLKIAFTNKFIHNHQIKTIVDYGCGAGNFTSGLAGLHDYTGYDISESCINICKAKFKGRENVKFTSDINTVPSTAELAISMDVLFHQVEDDDFNTSLAQLFRHKFVMIYSSDTNNNEGLHIHMNLRKITDVIGLVYPNYELILKQGGFANKFFFIYQRK